jgi:hypothetical protein
MLENINQEQRKDPLYSAMLDYLCEQKVPVVLKTSDLFAIGGKGQLLRILKGAQAQPLCITRDMVRPILHDCHDVAGAAHPGRGGTLNRVKQSYWWPTLAKDVANYVASCDDCLRFKRPPKPTVQPLGDRPPPTYVWERVHADVWSPGGVSLSGNICVLAFIDAFSKFLVAVPLRDHQASTFVDTFTKKVAVQYGLPSELVTDGAPEFRSRLQNELFKIYGVSRHVTTPYRPQANGMIERIFRTIRPMLATLARRCPTNWDMYLPLVVHAYNTAYHVSISETPFYLMFGRDPAPLVHSNADVGRNIPTDLKSRVEMLTLARRVVASALVSEQRRSKRTFDRKARPRSFSVGEVVLLQSILPPNAQVKKLFPRYVGPYRIMSMKGHTLGVKPLQIPDASTKYIHSDRAIHCGDNCVLQSSMNELVSPFLDYSSVDPHLDAESAD